MPDLAQPIAPFGSFKPSVLQEALIGFGHAMPRNWLGQRGTTLARFLLQHWLSRPVDGQRLGSKMRLNPVGNASERRLLVCPQFFDAEVLALLATRITPDFVFIDIGANAGTYSLFVAGRAGSNARILAVEPNPGARERLTCNLALNNYHCVEVVPAALGPAAGEVELVVNPRNMGASSILGDWDRTKDSYSVRVPCETLQGLVERKGLSRIDALKIDVEGAEDQVLVPFLESTEPELRPRFLITEDNRTRWRRDLVAVATALGYQKLLCSGGNVVLAAPAG